MILYVNGALVATQNVPSQTPTPNSGGALNLGAELATNFLAGTIDDVRVYNRALSASDVLTLYNSTATACAGPVGYTGDEIYNSDYHVLQFCNGTNWIPMGKPWTGAAGGGCASPAGSEGTILFTSSTFRAMQYCDSTTWRAMGNTPITGLIGWWNFDEGSGTSAADSTGNGNTGALQNTPTWTTSGKINGALTFNGTNQEVDTASIAGITNTFTVAFWEKTSVTSGQVIWQMGGSAVCKVDYSGHNIGCTVQANTATTIAATAIDDGNWHHIAYVVNNTTQNLYVDGVSKATGTETPAGLPNTSCFGGGNCWGTSSWFNGTIDDARVYNRALSASEVWRLYNGAP